MEERRSASRTLLFKTRSPSFGLYGTPRRQGVFDPNDFDETVIGPWEWDLKRLVASVNVAGRQNGLNRRERAAAVEKTVDGYRFNLSRLESMGVIDTWYLHAYPSRDNALFHPDRESKEVVKKVLAKASRTDNRSLLAKIAVKNSSGEWKFKMDPPVLTPVSRATKHEIIEALNRYSSTLSRERRFMLSRYHVADVAHRIVGVGSVGTRAYLAMLFGNRDNDPLFLQIKESVAAAHSPYLPALDPEFSHNGKRVVIGQRALQASSDPMLGYTSMDGRDYYVRQMKNLKASIEIESLTSVTFEFYVWACGSLLARAHARTGDCALISGYCGKSSSLDEALASWAESYGNQVVSDHGDLVNAIREGKVKATKPDASD
jgi:uncharacterized protein (DUF2252 family)